ncbi:MAG: 23S rRNA (uracil(1939)-C(5))-methyltransferase RlmD [Porticoccaceae bacterium]|nr:23S rRNA (uracil(1939)-C(5))-methyltransferase RlmD [Porticoccaceae bacterium]
MSDKQNLSCDIVDLSYDGRGIGRINGKTCFIDGALPSETVTFRLTNQKRNYDEGRITQVTSVSQHRVEPRCKHFYRCGGCSLQHLNHHQQLEFKQQQLLANLQRGGLTPQTVLPALSAPQWGYRRRAKLAVQRAKDGRLLIGFRNAGSRRIEPITQCPILTAPLPEVIKLLPNWLAALPQAIRIYEVELVSADHSFAIAVEASRLPSDKELQSILSGLEDMNFGAVQLWWKTGKQTPFKRLDSGHDPLTFSINKDIQLAFEPGQFIQVNSEINRLMIAQMLELLPDQSITQAGTAIDLYCGTGNLSLPLAQRFNNVVGIEGLAELVKGAKENARMNGINNVEFAVADLNQSLSVANVHKGKEPVDLVLLDPPRNGAAQIMPWIAKTKARQIIYISCHPATMIRDAAVLTESGYKLVAAGVMDMFPHTSHIEAITLFEK